MNDNSIRRLPELDDGDLVGILTTTDLTHQASRCDPFRLAVGDGYRTQTTETT